MMISFFINDFFGHFYLKNDRVVSIIELYNKKTGTERNKMGSLIKKKEFREDKLLSVLKAKKRMDTSEVVELLQISESTARRFFNDLEKKGVLLRTYGGIQIAPDSDADYFYDDLLKHQSEQKKRIGEYACSLVEEGDILFLDSGTTLQHMAAALSQRLKDGTVKDIEIYTNSLVNLKILSQYCDVHVTGGLFRGKRQDFCGYLSEIVLQTIAFKKCFLGSDGISLAPAEGIMATDVFTSRVNEIVAGRSDKIYILADSTKFMRRSFIRYASLDAPELFISDTDLNDQQYSLFSAAGVQIVRV